MLRRRSTDNDMLITVQAPKAAGKTTLLDLFLGMLADNGLLSVADTKAYTERPMGFLAQSRLDNLDACESIEVEIDPAAVKTLAIATRDYRNGVDTDEAGPAPRLHAAIEIDPLLLTVMSSKEAILRQINAALDAATAAGHDVLLPMTITIDPYNIPKA